MCILVPVSAKSKLKQFKVLQLTVCTNKCHYAAFTLVWSVLRSKLLGFRHAKILYILPMEYASVMRKMHHQ